MPLFEYVCENCGNTCEKIKKFDDEMICECGTVMKRGVSKAAFELKGSGWFKDGYSKS